MRSSTRYRILIISLLAASVTAIGIGVFRGEAAEIYQKGITICLSCIGIG